MPKNLEDLSRCADVGELRTSLHTLCARFGSVQHLEILTSVHEGARQAICFLRLTDAAQERAFMQAFDVGRFDGELVFVIDWPDRSAAGDDEWAKPSSQWAEFGGL